MLQRRSLRHAGGRLPLFVGAFGKETAAERQQRLIAMAKQQSDGLKKGGLKSPDDAKLHLGVADLGAGRIADATAVLNSVSAADGTWDLAKVWLIRSAGQ
jgi:hypothetical protein